MSSKAPDAAVASKLNADNASRALKEAWQQSRPEEAKRALQSLLADASSAKAGCGKSEAARALRELSEALPALFREAWALSALEKTLFYDSGSKHVPRAVKSAHGVLGCRLIHRAFRDESLWPKVLLKLYCTDSFGPRSWLQNQECAPMVQGIKASLLPQDPIPARSRTSSVASLVPRSAASTDTSRAAKSAESSARSAGKSTDDDASSSSGEEEVLEDGSHPTGPKPRKDPSERAKGSDPRALIPPTKDGGLSGSAPVGKAHKAATAHSNQLQRRFLEEDVRRCESNVMDLLRTLLNDRAGETSLRQGVQALNDFILLPEVRKFAIECLHAGTWASLGSGLMRQLLTQLTKTTRKCQNLKSAWEEFLVTLRQPTDGPLICSSFGINEVRLAQFASRQEGGHEVLAQLVYRVPHLFLDAIRCLLRRAFGTAMQHSAAALSRRDSRAGPGAGASAMANIFKPLMSFMEQLSFQVGQKAKASTSGAQTSAATGDLGEKVVEAFNLSIGISFAEAAALACQSPIVESARAQWQRQPMPRSRVKSLQDMSAFVEEPAGASSAEAAIVVVASTFCRLLRDRILEEAGLLHMPTLVKGLLRLRSVASPLYSSRFDFLIDSRVDGQLFVGADVQRTVVFFLAALCRQALVLRGTGALMTQKEIQSSATKRDRNRRGHPRDAQRTASGHRGRGAPMAGGRAMPGGHLRDRAARRDGEGTTAPSQATSDPHQATTNGDAKPAASTEQRNAQHQSAELRVVLLLEIRVASDLVCHFLLETLLKGDGPSRRLHTIPSPGDSASLCLQCLNMILFRDDSQTEASMNSLSVNPSLLSSLKEGERQYSSQMAEFACVSGAILSLILSIPQIAFETAEDASKGVGSSSTPNASKDEPRLPAKLQYLNSYVMQVLRNAKSRDGLFSSWQHAGGPGIAFSKARRRAAWLGSIASDASYSPSGAGSAASNGDVHPSMENDGNRPEIHIPDSNAFFPLLVQAMAVARRDLPPRAVRCMEDLRKKRREGNLDPEALALAQVFWKSCMVLVALAAWAPRSVGLKLWNEMPTFRCLMQMSVCSTFSFPPPGARHTLATMPVYKKRSEQQKLDALKLQAAHPLLALSLGDRYQRDSLELEAEAEAEAEDSEAQTNVNVVVQAAVSAEQKEKAWRERVTKYFRQRRDFADPDSVTDEQIAKAAERRHQSRNRLRTTASEKVTSVSKRGRKRKQRFAIRDLLDEDAREEEDWQHLPRKRRGERDLAASRRISKAASFDADAKAWNELKDGLIEFDLHSVARRPPSWVIEAFQKLDQELNIGSRLRGSREPDFIRAAVGGGGHFDREVIRANFEWLVPALSVEPTLTLPRMPQAGLAHLLLVAMTPDDLPNVDVGALLRPLTKRLRRFDKILRGDEACSAEDLAVLRIIFDELSEGDANRRLAAFEALKALHAQDESVPSSPRPSQEVAWLSAVIQARQGEGSSSNEEARMDPVASLISKTIRDALQVETDPTILLIYLEALSMGSSADLQPVCRFICDRFQFARDTVTNHPSAYEKLARGMLKALEDVEDDGSDQKLATRPLLRAVVLLLALVHSHGKVDPAMTRSADNLAGHLSSSRFSDRLGPSLATALCRQDWRRLAKSRYGRFTVQYCSVDLLLEVLKLSGMLPSLKAQCILRLDENGGAAVLESAQGSWMQRVFASIQREMDSGRLVEQESLMGRSPVWRFVKAKIREAPFRENWKSHADLRALEKLASLVEIAQADVPRAAFDKERQGGARPDEAKVEWKAPPKDLESYLRACFSMASKTRSRRAVKELPQRIRREGWSAVVAWLFSEAHAAVELDGRLACEALLQLAEIDGKVGFNPGAFDDASLGFAPASFPSLPRWIRLEEKRLRRIIYWMLQLQWGSLPFSCAVRWVIAAMLGDKALFACGVRAIRELADHAVVHGRHRERRPSDADDMEELGLDDSDDDDELELELEMHSPAGMQLSSWLLLRLYTIRPGALKAAFDDSQGKVVESKPTETPAQPVGAEPRETPMSMILEDTPATQPETPLESSLLDADSQAFDVDPQPSPVLKGRADGEARKMSEGKASFTTPVRADRTGAADLWDVWIAKNLEAFLPTKPQQPERPPSPVPSSMRTSPALNPRRSPHWDGRSSPSFTLDSVPSDVGANPQVLEDLGALSGTEQFIAEEALRLAQTGAKPADSSPASLENLSRNHPAIFMRILPLLYDALEQDIGEDGSPSNTAPALEALLPQSVASSRRSPQSRQLSFRASGDPSPKSAAQARGNFFGKQEGIRDASDQRDFDSRSRLTVRVRMRYLEYTPILWTSVLSALTNLPSDYIECGLPDLLTKPSSKGRRTEMQRSALLALLIDAARILHLRGCTSRAIAARKRSAERSPPRGKGNERSLGRSQGKGVKRKLKDESEGRSPNSPTLDGLDKDKVDPSEASAASLERAQQKSTWDDDERQLRKLVKDVLDANPALADCIHPVRVLDSRKTFREILKGLPK